MVLVTIPSLDITIMRTTTQITVAITESSSLVRDCGLCGTRTGALVLPNGNTVTQPSEAFITAYMIPPTDTFVLPNRDQCGEWCSKRDIVDGENVLEELSQPILGRAKHCSLKLSLFNNSSLLACFIAVACLIIVTYLIIVALL